MIIGILALQGDFFAHGRVLHKLGRDYIYVKTPEELGRVKGLILPGGESTTMRKLAMTIGLWEPLKKYHGPILGTCAGIILLAKDITNPPEESLGLLDVTVSRNAYGSQIDSFASTGTLVLAGRETEMVFIRAPRITSIGSGVDIIAKLQGEPVGVRQKQIIGLTYHPELSSDTTIHEEFLRLVESPAARKELRVESSR